MLRHYLCSFSYVTSNCPAPPRSGQKYAQWRARQIAYGQWEPWVPATPVREHVQQLRRSGASFRAVGRAAGVSATTVHRLLNGEPTRCRAAPHRMRAGEARRLLAVTPGVAARAAARPDAAGTRRRLRALTAVGYPAVSLAAHTGVTPGTIRDLVSGHAATVSPALHAAVAALYAEMWDQPPPERTGAQRRATAAARSRAARNHWPPPMGLDDDQIDEPGYRPRTRWRPVTTACAASPPMRHAAGRGRPRSRHPATPGQSHAGRGR
jgi:hypothetical protein